MKNNENEKIKELWIINNDYHYDNNNNNNNNNHDNDRIMLGGGAAPPLLAGRWPAERLNRLADVCCSVAQELRKSQTQVHTRAQIDAAGHVH